MLKLVKIKDPSLKLSFLSEFHPEKTAFICSDIKNKQFLESQLLKKHPFLSGSSVLRANEFYKAIFTSLNKRWDLRSDAFVKQLLSQFLESQKNTKHLIQSEVFFKWFQFCWTFFLQDSSGSLFKEWFYSSKKNLFPKEWLKLFEGFFKLLADKNILYESGVKACLSNELSSFKACSFEKEVLLVDLAFSMDLCEKELFKELSRFKEVYILAPVLEWNFLFENKGYDFYSEWEKELDKKNVIYLNSDFSLSKKPSVNSQIPSFFAIENRTQNQEIQQAVGQVSQWLQQGISPEEIVIYTPNIEDNWFILKDYLERQSIPYKKTSYTSLIEFSEIKYILSALRFYLNLFEFQDLETFYFYKDSKKDFTKLKQKYFEVLKRDSVQKPFLKERERDFKQLVSGFDFVEWALSFWRSDFSKTAESSFLKVLKKLLIKDQLSYQSWLELLESAILSEDIELEKESPYGVSCLSFNAFHSVQSPYVILLGLGESAFKDSCLAGDEALSSLLNDLGFGLDLKLPQEKDKSLLWFLQSSHHKEVYLSHYLYDLEGNIEGRAFISMFLQEIYLQKSDRIKKDESHCKEKQERLKQSHIEQSRSRQNQIKHSQHTLIGESDSKLTQAQILKALLKDKSEKQIKALEKAFFESGQPFFHPELKSLSVSQLKTYTDCPFKYAADKLFLIQEEQVLKQELSPLIKGKTAHELFNKILEKHPDLDLTAKQKEDLIDELIPDKEHFSFKKEQVLLLKDYLKYLINQFLLKEKKQRTDCPSVKPLGFEASLKAFWDQKKGELSSKGDYLFKGNIDRIDQDKSTQTYIVRDYKASLNQLTHISSWVKKDDIQLIFYAQALEKGLVEGLAPAEVSALFYSAYHEDFKAKGFIEKESELDKLIEGKQSFYMKPREELMTAISAVNKKTQKLVSQIEEGEFAPQPKDKKLCQSCSYKNLCRVGAYV